MSRLDGLDGLTQELDMTVAIRRPGYVTIRRKVQNWGEVNALVIEIAEKRDYPHGTVMTVDDWTGRDRFSLRGGKDTPARLIQLSNAVRGLPENPKPVKQPSASASVDPRK